MVIERDGGRVTGLLPLVATGRGPTRTLRFAGGVLGDLFHPLSDDRDEELAAAALGALRARGERGAIVLDKVEQGAPWVAALTGGETSTPLPHRDEVLPEIEIGGGSWEDYLASRSRNMRSQLGRRRRRLEREHEVAVRRSDEATLDADLAAFFDLHHGRWEGRGGSGALDQRSMAFHSDFARAALSRGWLRLWVMDVDGSPAAAWYGWRIGDRYAYYLAGFDEAYGSLSIGTLLLANTIEGAIEEGAATYDLLRGSEEYKSRYATGEREIGDLIVSSRGHPVRVAALGESAVRRAVHRLSPETRERVKARLARVADRLPFR